MTGSLFDPPAGPREAKAPPITPTATLVRVGRALKLVHPCGRCGNPVAPFGMNVNLRAAIEHRDGRRAGMWLCAACREAR